MCDEVPRAQTPSAMLICRRMRSSYQPLMIPNNQYISILHVNAGVLLEFRAAQIRDVRATSSFVVTQAFHGVQWASIDMGASR